MGYTTKGSITSFWPDEDDNTKYMAGEWSLSDLLAAAVDKWPNTPMEEIQISAEKIHTDCIYYDLYDSGDWTDFVVMRRT